MRYAGQVLMAAWSVAACGTSPLESTGDPVPGETSTVTREATATGDTLRLRPGELVEVGEEGLRIGFVGVPEDSRCPQGVTCVWEGDAVARLSVSFGSEEPVDVDLHTTLEPGEVVRRGHAITLVDVEPHPVRGEEIDPGAYRAVLVVSRP